MTPIDYGRIKVLVIEDEVHTRSIIRSQLLQIGVREIAEAAHGKEGLVQVARVKPHIILCDVHMEPVDGLEFLRVLRKIKLEVVRNTPVIFLTADAQSDTVLFAKEHAVNGYLVKPVSAAQLKAHIDKIAANITLPPAEAAPPPGHYTFPKRDP
jgi:two-component system chemotaxis response regulator CheY